MRLVCGNCRAEFQSHDELDEVSDLTERMFPGDLYPDGQCPKCGSLVGDEDDPRAVAVSNSQNHAYLLQCAKDVLEWETQQGGWEATCWDRLRNAVNVLREEEK